MRIKPSLGLVVGPFNAVHWSQVLTTPSAYGIVEIEDAEGHAQEHGVALLSQLAELLNHDLQSLHDLEDVCDRVTQAHIRTLIVLVPIGTVIYLVVRGKGMVYVKRGSELASLMHTDGAISGEVKLNDTILLASDGFTGVLTREELSGLFDHLPPVEIAEKLTLLLHEKTGGEGSVALVFGVSQFSDLEAVVPVEAAPSSIEAPHSESTQSAPEPQLPKQDVPAQKKETLFARLAKVRSFRLRFAPKEWATYVASHPKHMIAVATVLMISFFVVSVVLGVMKQASVKKNQRVEAITLEAQHALEEGVALLELNPAKGRERLEQAQKLLEPLRETVSARTVEGRKVLEVYQTISDNLTLALRISKVTPTLYYDVSLLKKNGAISSLSRDGNAMVLSDLATNTIYKMDIASKNAQIIGGGADLKGPLLVTVHGIKSYVLTDGGVMEITPGAKKPALVIKKDEEWGTIQSIVSFGGNIYLLDVIKSRIWKYVATEKGFSERREYLNPDTLPDLTRTSGLAIDGSVFMGNQDGTVLRFTQGKENTYFVKGVDPAFGKSPIVYTSDDTTHIYVLDTSNSRIVVLDKEGMYVSQYQYAGQHPTQFAVYEELKKIVLLISGKLYTIELK